MLSFFIAFLVIFFLLLLFIQYAFILIMFYGDGSESIVSKNFKSKKDFFISCIPFYWLYWIVMIDCINHFMKAWKEMPNE